MPLVVVVVVDVEEIPREEEGFEGVDAQNGHGISLILSAFSSCSLCPLPREWNLCLFRETRHRQSLKARLAAVLLPGRPLFFHY